jgi:hypothetical protein
MGQLRAGPKTRNDVIGALRLVRALGRLPPAGAALLARLALLAPRVVPTAAVGLDECERFKRDVDEMVRPSVASAPTAPAHNPAQPAPPTPPGEAQLFLAGLGLGEHSAAFAAEEVDLNPLRDVARLQGRSELETVRWPAAPASAPLQRG